MNAAITDNDIVASAVLSGNRNFEARIHPNIRSNFLASPPLVVAYAIAGNMTRDLMTEPVGKGTGGRDVYLGDIWPSSKEVNAVMKFAMNADVFKKNYADVKGAPGKLWEKVTTVSGQVYNWPTSTYIAEPPFFDDFTMTPKAVATGISGARALGVFGDSITTDHISPAGSIQENGPAGKWLKAKGVLKADFNSYGSRRGNHEIMMRGTFANVRIKNRMIPAKADGSAVEGGITIHQPSGEQMSIYDAAMRYVADGVPTMVFGGEEYGTGSSRDWAAKGTQLLGVKAVITRSFERIHRSNLVGMGVLPLQFIGDDSVQTLGILGNETFDLKGLEGEIKPQQLATLVIHRANGETQDVRVLLRIDTPIEVDYYKHGGILPFVLRQLLAA
jgi:aconitate hydratase